MIRLYFQYTGESGYFFLPDCCTDVKNVCVIDNKADNNIIIFIVY